MMCLEIATLQDFAPNARASGAIAPCEEECCTHNVSRQTLLWKFLPTGLFFAILLWTIFLFHHT